MSQGIENHIDWTVPSGPRRDRVGPGISRKAQPKAAEKPKRSVMDTLLGDNNLAAYDAAGDDPYNATGRHFRR
jgi:hypothetical protein